MNHIFSSKSTNHDIATAPAAITTTETQTIKKEKNSSNGGITGIDVYGAGLCGL